MIRFCFKKGLAFIDGAVRRQLMRRLASGKLQFEQDNGEIENFTDSEVLAKWSCGKWVIDETSLGSATDVLYLATPRDLSTFPERWQKVARRRELYLRHVDPDNNKFSKEGWRKRILKVAAEMNDPKPPSPSSVHGWWQRYRTTRSLNTLVPQIFGGRSRHTDPRYVLFEEVVSEV